MTYPLDFQGPEALPFEPMSSELLDTNVISRFLEIAQRFPHQLAVSDGIQSLSYKELTQRMLQLAGNIAQQKKL